MPSDEVLQQLADLLVVPSEQREFFFESVCTNVQTAWELDGLAKQGLVSKKGKKFVAAALTLYDTLGNLTRRERELIKGIFSKAALFLTGFQAAEYPAWRKLRTSLHSWPALSPASLPPGIPPNFRNLPDKVEDWDR